MIAAIWAFAMAGQIVQNEKKMIHLPDSTHFYKSFNDFSLTLRPPHLCAKNALS
jgi:hypothetical protein